MKILTTIAGFITLAFTATACGPAVDTQETTSTTPITATAQRVDDIRKEMQEFKISRNAVRPVTTPVASTHENHVNHANIVAAQKAAKARAIALAQAKAERVAEAKAKRIARYKAIQKRKAEQAKKVVKKVQKTYSPTKVSISGIAFCIGKYESGNNPTAQNPTSTASGYYQIIDGTWAGFGGYDRAKDAPLSVQTQKFYQLWDNGRGAHHWVVRGKCGW